MEYVEKAQALWAQYDPLSYPPLNADSPLLNRAALAAQDLPWTPSFSFYEATRKYVLDVVPGGVLFVVALTALYYPLFISIPSFLMRNRNALSLRAPLILWNTALAIYSWWSFYKIFPIVSMQVQRLGFMDAVCDNTVYTHPDAIWILVFQVSKVVEWVDTLFLVLRKRNVSTLHSVHHAMTYLYAVHSCLFSFRTDASCFYFGAFNMLVHGLMYGYYALVALGFRSLRKLGFLLTVLQTLQMVVGLGVVIVTTQCPLTMQLNWHGVLFAAVMYGIYFYLFFQLLLEKMPGRKSAGSVSSKSKKQK